MQILAPSARRTGFGAPLIGRDDEVAVLRAVSQTVRDERTFRAVTVIGPNGVGKSRLIRHIVEDIAAQSGRRFRVYRGAAKGRSSSYEPFASLLRARFGLVESADPEEARAQLRGQVAKVLDDRKVGDVCFFLGHILDLPFPPSPLTKAVSDDPLQGVVLRRAVIRNFIETDAARGPLCLVFEDLDVAGDDALELVAHLVEHLSGPTLVLCSARPELLARRGDWFELGAARHDRIELGPVPDAVAEQVMTALLGPCVDGPPLPLVEAGVRLAGGNVGLLEAMVRIFHDCGVLVETTPLAVEPAWSVNLARLGNIELPGTVEDTVAMRVAALSPDERRLLEHAAILGAVFFRGALLALRRSECPPPPLWNDDTPELDDIDRILRSLEKRDYVVRLPSPMLSGEAEYAFKHNLEREKLVSLLSDNTRRAYHLTVANWLRAQESVLSVRDHSALLGQHLESAGVLLQAGLVYVDAADSARDSYAAKEASEYYRRGLALLGESDAHRRIDALHNYGDVLSTLGRTEEARNAFREMLAIAHRMGKKAKGGAAHNRLGRIYRTVGSLSEAMAHFETALKLFDAAGDERGVASCHDDVGKVFWMQGDYEAALQRMNVALDMRKTIGDRRSIALSLHNLGIVWRDNGQPAQAQGALESSLKIRREIGDLLGVAQALNSLGRVAQDQRKLEQGRELYRQAYDVAVEIGERNRIAVVLTNLGEIHYRMGDSAEAIRILKEAENLSLELGDKLHLAEAKRGLSKAYLMQGDLKTARTCITSAMDLFGQVRSKPHLATALRTLGEITAAGAWGPSHEGKAVDYFMRSIALCKEVGNDVEIAKSYRSFSDYVLSAGHYRDNDDIVREARRLGAMADEIFARLRIPTAGRPREEARRKE